MIEAMLLAALRGCREKSCRLTAGDAVMLLNKGLYKKATDAVRGGVPASVLPCCAGA